jgi:selenocysteine-specific elongation factor
MPLIGTAGHVDHGKSTLVQWITGRDPDRFDEEQSRGLTIDLGFAWTTLPDGTELSFVDVPGHERYLKNMLAGIEAIDVALFVVAADESWMPQSEEHLAVLDLLGVERGVVAVTKCDAVEPELAEVARIEVSERLTGSSLEAAPIHLVSGVTGDGVAAMLDDLAGMIPTETSWSGRPRMWVDRSFTISGAGTVVTGSLLGAPLSSDGNVEIYPKGIEGRIRGLQSHEQNVESAKPGRRVAINLAGIDHERITRGDMVGLPGEWELSGRFTAHLRRARFVDEIDRRGAYTLHVGSGAHQVDLIAVEGGFGLLKIEGELPLAVGDRFILRDTGRQLVVGGGRVLDPSPGKTRQALAQAGRIDPEAAPDEIADELLAARGIERLGTIAAHTGGGEPRDALRVGELAVDMAVADALENDAVDMVEREHAGHPLRAGLPVATLAVRLGVEPGVVEIVVDRSDRLERRGPDVALPEHRVRLSADQEEAWEAARSRLAGSLAVPSPSELGLDAEILHVKLRDGSLIRISPDIVYLPEQIETIEAHLAELGDGFTVAEFRDAVELSRKYAVPILEWSDKEGLTVRRGDVRHVR